jgi:hypothetical protein
MQRVSEWQAISVTHSEISRDASLSSRRAAESGRLRHWPVVGALVPRFPDLRSALIRASVRRAPGRRGTPARLLTSKGVLASQGASVGVSVVVVMALWLGRVAHCHACGFGVGQGGDGRVAAQLSRQRLRVGPMLPTGMPSRPVNSPAANTATAVIPASPGR